MLRKILVTLNSLDKLSDKMKNWYNSQSSLFVTLLILFLVAFALVLGVSVVSTFLGAIMLYLPWLCTFVILACVAIPLAVIAAGLILRRISAVAWVTAIVLSVFLMITAGGLFMFGGVGVRQLPDWIKMRLFPGKTRFPLGWLGGIAVDGVGRVYLAVQGYSRIQVYNSDGDFIKGWFVDTSGIFDIWIDDHDLLNVVMARTNSHALFDSDGRLLRIKEIASSEEFNTLTEKAGGLQDKDTLGNIYLIEDPKFLPAVVKITPAGKETVLIKDPIYFQSLCAPQPVLLFACGGLVMTAILGIVIKKKVEFPGVDAYTIRSCAKSQAKQ